MKKGISAKEFDSESCYDFIDHGGGQMADERKVVNYKSSSTHTKSTSSKHSEFLPDSRYVVLA